MQTLEKRFVSNIYAVHLNDVFFFCVNKKKRICILKTIHSNILFIDKIDIPPPN